MSTKDPAAPLRNLLKDEGFCVIPVTGTPSDKDLQKQERMQRDAANFIRALEENRRESLEHPSGRRYAASVPTPADDNNAGTVILVA